MKVYVITYVKNGITNSYTLQAKDARSAIEKFTAYSIGTIVIIDVRPL